MFSVKKATGGAKREVKATPTLTHDDPKVQAFYKQLTQQQIVAHSIAITHLGTSYDVMRTHGFINWAKNMPK